MKGDAPPTERGTGVTGTPRRVDVLKTSFMYESPTAYLKRIIFRVWTAPPAVSLHTYVPLAKPAPSNFTS
ncbi:MAG: hypothetical protein H6Q31_2064 [Bacteroidetes bacterium]|nr:hypothetical protein [Bacteroidota bacterium]